MRNLAESMRSPGGHVAAAGFAPKRPPGLPWPIRFRLQLSIEDKGRSFF